MGKVAEFRHEGIILDWANGGGTQIDVGDIVPLGSCCGVAVTDIPAGGTGSVRVSGVYDVETTNDFALVQGAVVYYDAATKKATNNTAKHFLGIAALKKATADKIVRVKIGYEWHEPYAGEETIQYYNSGATIPKDAIVPLANFIGIAAEEISGTSDGSVYITGVYELAAEHDTSGKEFAAGDLLYWHTNKLVKDGTSPAIPAGICVKAKTSAGETAKVRLGPGIPRAAV